jgi:hypothetical protein
VNGILKYFFVPARWTLIEIRTIAFLAIDLWEFICQGSSNRRITKKVVFIISANLAVNRRGASVPDYIRSGIIIRINVILRIITVEVVFKGTGDPIRLKSMSLWDWTYSEREQSVGIEVKSGKSGIESVSRSILRNRATLHSRDRRGIWSFDPSPRHFRMKGIVVEWWAVI